MTDSRSSVRYLTNNNQWQVRITRDTHPFALCDIASGGVSISCRSEDCDRFYVGLLVDDIIIKNQDESFGPFQFQIKRATVKLQQSIGFLVIVPANNQTKTALQHIFSQYFHHENNTQAYTEWQGIPYTTQISAMGTSRRLNYIRQETKLALTGVAQTPNEQSYAYLAVPHHIGEQKRPIGVIGPLLIQGDKIKSEVFAPLVGYASGHSTYLSRLTSCISNHGGITTSITGRQHILYYELHSKEPQTSFKLEKLILQHWHQWAATIASVPGVLNISLETKAKINSVALRLELDTKDFVLIRSLQSAGISFIERLLDFAVERAKLVVDRYSLFLNDSDGCRPKILLQSSSFVRIPIADLKKHFNIDCEDFLDFYVSNIVNVDTVTSKKAEFEKGFDLATGQESDSQVHSEDTFSMSRDQDELIIYFIGAKRPFYCQVNPGAVAENSCLDMMDCRGFGKESRLSEIKTAFSLVVSLVAWLEAYKEKEFCFLRTKTRTKTERAIDKSRELITTLMSFDRTVGSLIENGEVLPPYCHENASMKAPHKNTSVEIAIAKLCEIHKGLEKKSSTSLYSPQFSQVLSHSALWVKQIHLCQHYWSDYISSQLTATTLRWLANIESWGPDFFSLTKQNVLGDTDSN